MARRGGTRLALQAAYWRSHGRPDVAARIEAQLVAERRCVVCGRLLSNPASVSMRIGPECFKKGTIVERYDRLVDKEARVLSATLAEGVWGETAGGQEKEGAES